MNRLLDVSHHREIIETYIVRRQYIMAKRNICITLVCWDCLFAGWPLALWREEDSPWWTYFWSRRFILPGEVLCDSFTISRFFYAKAYVWLSTLGSILQVTRWEHFQSIYNGLEVWKLVTNNIIATELLFSHDCILLPWPSREEQTLFLSKVLRFNSKDF